MRHPALTRFFAAALAVVSAITLLSGGLCVKKAADSREKQNSERLLLDAKTTEARELREELDAMAEEYEPLEGQYDEKSWQHAKELLSYRKDLAMYTATEGGLKQGKEQLEEGYKALRMGWIQHDNALKALEEGEAQFLPGYQQYLEGKRQLEEGKEKLRQAEELKAQLPDLALLRAGLNAVKASENEFSAAVSNLQATIQNPPRDEETGEIDDAALRLQLGAQVTVLSALLATVRNTVAASYGAEELDAALQPTAAALNNLSAQLADGSRSPEELLASASTLLNQGQALPSSTAGAIAAADETLTMLENLPAMKAQLEATQTALEENEPMLLAAKEKIDEGKKQLEQAKNMLIYTESELIKGKKSIEEKEAEQAETRADLDRRKEQLEKNAKTLERLKAKVDAYSEKKDHFSNLRYALLADEGIAARFRDGEGLIDVAQSELARRSEETKREFEYRLAAAVGMLLAACAGIVAVAAAFRDRTGPRLLLPASLSLFFGAASEAISFYAGRGLIYTVLFVCIFSAGVIALNLKKV